jgi:hypothetical protein
MYMVMAMFILGTLSFVMAIAWRARYAQFAELFIYLRARFDPNEIDLSGRKHYSQCVSYSWVMKNIICRQSRIREALRDLMTDSTLYTVLILGSLISFLPIALAYLIVGGFMAAGGTFFLGLVAIIIVQAPFDVAMSHGLLSWLTEQDPLGLKESDLAYAEVASKSITRWYRVLIASGIFIVLYAPWSEPTLEVMIFAMSFLFNAVFVGIFIPLASINGAVAYLGFVSIVVLIIVMLLLLPGRIYGFLNRGKDIFSLDTQEEAEKSKHHSI